MEVRAPLGVRLRYAHTMRHSVHAQHLRPCVSAHRRFAARGFSLSPLPLPLPGGASLSLRLSSQDKRAKRGGEGVGGGRTQARHGLAQQSAATTDVQQAQAAERLHGGGIQREVRTQCLPDERTSHLPPPHTPRLASPFVCTRTAYVALRGSLEAAYTLRRDVRKTQAEEIERAELSSSAAACVGSQTHRGLGWEEGAYWAHGMQRRERPVLHVPPAAASLCCCRLACSLLTTGVSSATN
jgi:hypothetical protein